MEAGFRRASQARHSSYARRKRGARRTVLHPSDFAAGVRYRARDAGALSKCIVHQLFQSGKPHYPGARKYSPIAALGLCHGIFMGQNDVARIMALPPEQVEVWGAGINHFQCLLKIRDRTTGEDLYPVLRAKEAKYNSQFAPLTRRLFRAFGYWMTCSDEHLGEYLSYGWEGGEKGYDFAADERERIRFSQELECVLATGSPPPQWLTPSGERGAAAIGGIIHNNNRVLESGIVFNSSIIPNLPAEAAVEVPVMTDADGIHPISLGPLPDPIAKLLTMQVNVQQLAVEAAVHASKEIALQALLIDPVVNSAKAAERILDELWEINRPYIRPCI